MFSVLEHNILRWSLMGFTQSQLYPIDIPEEQNVLLNPETQAILDAFQTYHILDLVKPSRDQQAHLKLSHQAFITHWFQSQESYAFNQYLKFGDFSSTIRTIPATSLEVNTSQPYIYLGLKLSPESVMTSSQHSITEFSRSLLQMFNTQSHFQTLLQHPEISHDCIFSHDGKLLFALSDRDIYHWDVETHRLIAIFKGHTEHIISLSFNPLGNRLVSTSLDKTLRIWDIERAETLFVLEGHSDHVWNAQFSPNGLCIASISSDKTICLWESATGRLLERLDSLVSEISEQVMFAQLGFSADGQCLLTYFSTGHLSLWNMNSTPKLVFFQEKSWHYLMLSPDKTRFLSVTQSMVYVRDSSTGQCLMELDRYYEHYIFSPDSQQLAAIYRATHCRGTEIRIWDIETKRMRVLYYQCVNSSINSLTFSPCGTYIALKTGIDASVILNAETGVILLTLKGDIEWSNTVVFSPNGKHFASTFGDANIQLWSTELWAKLKTIIKQESSISCSIAVSLNKFCIVSTSPENVTEVWFKFKNQDEMQTYINKILGYTTNEDDRLEMPAIFKRQ